MRFLHSFVPSLLLLAAGAVQAAPSWGFDDAKLTVSPKKAAVDAKEKGIQQFSDKSPVPQTPVVFDNTDTLKLLLTAKEGGKAKRPHQAFLVLREPISGLEAPFPLTVKESGRAIVEIKHSDLPVQLALATEPLRVSLVLASFGSAEGLDKHLFDLEIKLNPGATPIVYEKPLRYGKREEIYHTFRDDPKNPPKIISIAFVLLVVAALPALYIAWLSFGANVSHLPQALSAAPVAHVVFFGSIVGMEGVFYLYYRSWNLFQVLPVAGLVGAVTFLSSTKALGEVQRRRLAGER
ncbi:Oligosaccharyltransferase subunit Ribophorin II-domain-containing protein [Durotheca rogersii]|uniref:Oligosaccharyltransferase subunit Ribophorin II-domain-containing protein n=1 Tax=Durotheca rogersii TaxID=419775 RepID=UPI002220FD38|nr:Oligosaccharyltransferase subunit Ribophorin II-domain-containing protein [Durotheca rogersii]KAI5864788.1 Oligosaccharyltransferase subunit Ribophorin II-domain-containing protein [Durotheca rogersii]